MATHRDLLDLLLELQALDRLPRTGYVLRGVTEPESVAEHSFHVAWLVWAIARQLPEIDTERAMALALLHDVPEVRLGDLPRSSVQALPDGAKAAAEETIGRELLAPLGEEATALLAEYRDATSPEARLVRACDKLQLLVKVAVYQGWGEGGLEEFWDNAPSFDDAPEPLAALARELLERVAERRGW